MNKYEVNINKSVLSKVFGLLEIKGKQSDLLMSALIHPSALNGSDKAQSEQPSIFQRLEFLGDRVLGLVIAESLMDIFPEESEGDLARRYAVLVSKETLAKVTLSIGLAPLVVYGSGEKEKNGADNASTMADVCEAVIGAIYLDYDIDTARHFIQRNWIGLISGQHQPPRDPKTTLQEWSQSLGLGLPHYEVISQGGPAHSPTFEIKVKIEGLFGVLGSGKSKRTGERSAAENMLTKLKEDGRITNLVQS